jgi:3'-phosphoadenosine 5'-phosphosulfate sulfotransferase (PAPS reductase)/FAD synthetase
LERHFILQLHWNPQIQHALDNGAALIVSVSGGKDSDAMALVLHRARQHFRWRGRFILCHADLGRMEWPQSLPHCRDLVDRLDAEFVVVQHDHDLLEGIQRRRIKRPDAPPFPSAAARYCTATWKRSVIDKYIRRTFPRDQTVICAMGLRAEESATRARRDPCAPRTKASAPTKNRHVLDWLPIHHWALAQVWAEIGYTLDELRAIQTETRHTGVVPSDFKAHPAYALGNERVSCALCVLASRNDLGVGAAHNPDLYRQLVDLELESGYSFQPGRWLADSHPHLLTDTQRERLAAMRQPEEVTPTQLTLF